MSNELEVEELAAMVTDMLNAMLFFAGVKKENLEAASKAYIKEIDFFFENEESDEETIGSLLNDSNTLEDAITSLEISMMLSGQDDSKNAIITIHPGAGGTESQDWASILYRMYLRWAERMHYGGEVLDFNDGDEAGSKGVSIILIGVNSYGYMKAENGIHRLVRISPFDSNAKRHTSFTSVMATPEVDDDIEIEIEDKDIRVDTYRASGAGGQHVN